MPGGGAGFHPMQFGVDPNAADNNGSTALTVAAYWGHIEVIEALLEVKAAPDKPDGSGQTPYKIASHEGHAECAALLRDAEMRHGFLRPLTMIMIGP